jgi:polyketide biosynthesis 3-hydroxy-3-methylglutaryl-CoA synthase-like enzyme PksG
MSAPQADAAPSAVGIEDLSVYAGLLQIPVPELFRGRGLDQGRLENIMMRQRSIGLPFEDPVTNAVNAAKPLLDRLPPEDVARIELVVTSTESGLDFSKSVASYVHDKLGLPSTCRMLEVKQACFAATAALQLAVGYVASAMSPGAKVLIIATDIALVDEVAGYAEPATGHGAVALLIGENPRVLAVDFGAFGNHSYETMDSARPTPNFDIADVDRSLFAYLDCLSCSYADYASKVEGADFAETFNYLAMHTPFAGLVKAGHRKLMKEQRAGRGTAASVDEDFERRVAPSLVYPARIGNMCSGSVYLALASVIDHAPDAWPARVGLYAYGSGCSSEFFSGTIDDRSRAAVAAGTITARLDARTEIDFATYAELLPLTQQCLTPVADATVDVDAYHHLVPDLGTGDLLVHVATKDYHRQYAWL